jgi:20S proteasome alpha/beta subunit
MLNDYKNLGENRLEAGIVTGSRFRKIKRKAPVTIAIGIIHRTGIVVASDSRTMNPDYTFRDDAQKIREIYFSDGQVAVMAQSGDDDLGQRIVEIVANEASNKAISDWQSVSDIVDDVISKEQQKYKLPFLGPGYSIKEFADILREVDLSFLFAHYYKTKPYIFTSSFFPGRASPKHSNFVSIGCGAPLANFLLDSFDVSHLTGLQAIAAAIYVIEEVKAFDPRCGGAVRVASIDFVQRQDHMEPNLVLMHDEALEPIVSEISKLRRELKGEWSKRMQEVILKITVQQINRGF